MYIFNGNQHWKFIQIRWGGWLNTEQTSVNFFLPFFERTKSSCVHYSVFQCDGFCWLSGNLLMNIIFPLWNGSCGWCATLLITMPLIKGILPTRDTVYGLFAHTRTHIDTSHIITHTHNTRTQYTEHMHTTVHWLLSHHEINTLHIFVFIANNSGHAHRSFFYSNFELSFITVSIFISCLSVTVYAYIIINIQGMYIYYMLQRAHCVFFFSNKIIEAMRVDFKWDVEPSIYIYTWGLRW